MLYPQTTVRVLHALAKEKFLAEKIVANARVEEDASRALSAA